jgi:hypothetical protein
VNHNFNVEHTIRQRMLIRCKQLNFISELPSRCRQFNFSNESQSHCRTHNLAANVNSLQTTQFQRICKQYNFKTHNLTDSSISAANYKFAADYTTSAGNQNLLQYTQFGSEC